MRTSLLVGALGAAILSLLSLSLSAAMNLETSAASLGGYQRQIYQYFDNVRQGDRGQYGAANGARACERFVRDKAMQTDLAEVISGFYNNDVAAMFA
ncbi:hypothetical protein NGA_0412602 [Nannochloropsis gaditana CCMP526]|nr:hypothetical protein NGA_0412602 [Nannochloropsis gaditana CCMP526]EKU23215.1 hypothetical protein NGA_0412602 [Nannochloropsis gaditana CCMP526]|eukprot:XP_005852616.1 hypothetical protein NGA_0412602 [Nannochloropsis gaditana CCMP526]